MHALLTHDSRLLDLSLMQFECWNVFISFQLPRICLAPFQCRNSIRPFRMSPSRPETLQWLMEPYMEVGCSYPSMAGRSNSWGPSMIFSPQKRQLPRNSWINTKCPSFISWIYGTSSSYLVTSNPFEGPRIWFTHSAVYKKELETIMILWSVPEQDD